MPSSNTTFKPKIVVKKLLAALPDRARDVVVGRFGLGKSTDKLTLDAIGKKYGITRERVRQIENYALDVVRKSDAYKSESKTFIELEDLLRSLGGIVVEDDFLGSASKDQSLQNHVYFLLVLGDGFPQAQGRR